MNTENEIIEKARQNPKHFKPLYKKYFTPVFRFVLSKIGNTDITQDLVSDIFIKVISNLDKYDSRKGKFKTWLFTVAYNHTMQYLRNNNKDAEIIVDPDDLFKLSNEITELQNETSTGKEALLQAVVQELQTLPKDELELIELRFFDKLAFKEIAQLLNITENNARIKTHRIINKLKQSLTVKK